MYYTIHYALLEEFKVGGGGGIYMYYTIHYALLEEFKVGGGGEFRSEVENPYARHAPTSNVYHRWVQN